MPTIIIKKNWNTEADPKYPIGSEHEAELLPCTDDKSIFYACLKPYYIIPNGCFDVKPEIPSVEQLVASMNA